jgi:uncharacterized protein YjiS (DUF1127 family)
MDRPSFESTALRSIGLSKVLADVARRARTVIRDLPQRTLQWHERRKGLESLRALSDHQLRDIGLRRSEIVMAAYGEFDPHDAPQMIAVANAAVRPVPTVKPADNSDHDPCVGCAA